VIRAVLVLFAIASLSACGTPTPSIPGSAAAAPRDAIIYVIGRGWHTDIGLPMEEITGPLHVLETPFPGVRFLTIGFGDRTYLLKREVTVFSMLLALLPGHGALLVTALRAAPGTAFGDTHVVTLHVTRADLDRLEQRLWQAFEQTPEGTPVAIAIGPYQGSLFYAASEPYSGLFTCNTWTADMMHAAGLPMPIGGVLFAGQVMGMARWIASQQE
jgi:uncharacterized protein (TIGR02117 family)